MNFQQLRIIRETLRRNFNLTEVANALYTSQSGVSKHIKDLEHELGVTLFVRRGKRLLGLTEPGKELAGIVERILIDAQSLKKLGEQFAKRDEGRLAIATTHTQARYVLPPVVKSFKEAFPKVHLIVHEASGSQILAMLLAGEADIGIATEVLEDGPAIAAFPYYAWHHGVIVPAGHPLESKKPLSLEAIAEWPLVTYQEGFTGRAQIDRAFAAAKVEPDIAMSAQDADVIKTYVELGLGVGIVHALAFDAQRDAALRLLPAAHLFEVNTARIAVRRGSYLRGFAYHFMSLCVPALTESAVKAKLVESSEDNEP